MNKKNNITLYIISGLLAVLVIVMSVFMIIQILSPVDTVDSSSSDAASSAQSTASDGISTENVIAEPVKPSSSVSSNKASSVQKPVEPSDDEIPYVSSEETDQSQAEDKSVWFKQVYALAETTYKSELQAKKLPLESQRTELHNQREEYATKKLYAQQELMERYANMGLLDSGQYTSALNGLNNQYNSKISALDNQISQLDANIREINSEINNPDPNKILADIAVNNKLTSSQVVEYYNKYMAN